MGNEQILDESGVARESFAKGQVPTSVAITQTSTVILALDEDRAYAIVTVIVLSGDAVTAARGQTALALKGIPLIINVPQKFYGPEKLEAIIGAVETGTVAVQDFKLGVRRIGARA